MRQPRHIFSRHIPVPLLIGSPRAPAIVPDGMAAVSMPAAEAARGDRRGRWLPERMLLFDVKTLHGGGGLYFSARARDEQAGAVAERARRVGSEYEAHARRLDTQHSPAGTSPILDTVRSFTRVRGLVFGQYGEASQDVHDLLDVAATRMAARRWGIMGARTQEEARAFFIARLRRDLSVLVTREFARHRGHRIPYIGATHAAVQARGRRGAARPAAVMGGVRAADFAAYQAHLPAAI